MDILDWDGTQSRELRVVFPINLPQNYQLSYEVPFGTVEMGKDEIDFSDLPNSNLPNTNDSQFVPALYGGDKPLPFREAINWVDASSDRYRKFGCLVASDCTVHLFEDQTDNPVAYPMLQHVLLSTRKSLAWNPDYWFTQPGSYTSAWLSIPTAAAGGIAIARASRSTIRFLPSLPLEAMADASRPQESSCILNQPT